MENFLGYFSPLVAKSVLSVLPCIIVSKGMHDDGVGESSSKRIYSTTRHFMSCVLPYGHAEISCQENRDFYPNITTQQLRIQLVKVETTLHSDAATIRNHYVVCFKQLTIPYLFIYSIIYLIEVFVYLVINNKVIQSKIKPLVKIGKIAMIHM